MPAADMSRRNWAESLTGSYRWAIAGVVALILSRIDPTVLLTIVHRPGEGIYAIGFYALLIFAIILIGAALDYIATNRLINETAVRLNRR